MVVPHSSKSYEEFLKEVDDVLDTELIAEAKQQIHDFLARVSAKKED